MRRAVGLLAVVLLTGCGGAIPAARQRGPFQQPTQAFSPSSEARQCLADLGARGAGFSPLPDAYYGAGCATIDAVRLFAVSGDDRSFGISNLGAVTCPLANAFAGWARYGVDRAARQVLGSPLVRIETMGSYACRDVAGTERRSAHASANAIDVSGFDIADGRRITVLGDYYAGDAASRAFLRVVHASACKRFGTVLGPDYNAAHQSHFHVEVSARAFCR